MSPRLMLSLWRERWGKAAGTTFKVPYVYGKVKLWTDRLPYSEVWSVKGLPVFALLLCIVLMYLMMSINLSFNSQIVFSVLFICAAVFVRRYAGMLMTLVLVAMAVIASTRYLYWRFNATLTPDFSSDFLFGFYFFAAECYLALLVFTDLVQSIWPFKRAIAALPDAPDEWPTIDVFILCDDQSYKAIQLTTMAAGKLDWPGKKLKVYLIDGVQRDDLYTLAASIGAYYLPHADESGNHAGFINRSLPSTDGQFIAVFESGQVPPHHFLKSAVGWFLGDQKLALAQTPHHFLAPSPSLQNTEIVSSADAAQSCALMRRSAVVQMGGVDTAVPAQKSHTALTLQESGYVSAYLGFEGQEIFLIEYPFAGRSLLWKQRIASFHRAMQFYYPVSRLLFFITPAVCLTGNIQIIKSPPDLFLAYAIPHFLHAYIALARKDEKNRFTLFADIKEAALAWYMLIPTTLTLLRTEFKHCFASWTPGNSEPFKISHKTLQRGVTKLFSPAMLLLYLFVLGLSLAGFFSGMADMIFSSPSFSPSFRQQEVLVLYLLWTIYNLMLLAAMLAIAQEAKQVIRHTNLQMCLPAMIKLPSGRTVSCATENFPASVLELSLPLAVVVDTGAPVSISIFHAHRELMLPAAVVFQHDLRLEVRIADASQRDYQSFATSVLSRGPDWPKWLPGRGADQPFPSWMTKALVAIPVAILDFVTNINTHLHWARLDNLIQLWKRKK